jgi:uncharacterized protein with von Willebrand factor type A (vWA) domain
MRYRYSRWDGTQKLDDLSADDLLKAMSDDLLADGDLESAMRRMFHRGMKMPQGGQSAGLQDLLQQLRRRRQQQLDKFDLGSALDDIKKKLDEIVAKERSGITERISHEGERARKLGELDALPPDAPGKIKQLQDYRFSDPDARRMFDELMKQLQEQMLKPFMKNMQQALGNMTPQDLAKMREMMRDLNQMLRERLEGQEPDFQKFKDRWGQNFPGVESLDQLLEQIGNQMAQMQSLMRSLSPGQRRELEDMMRSLLMKDERLEAEMRRLGQSLSELLPMDEMARRYDFRGDEDVSMQDAMKLMDELQQMEQLERQLRGVKDAGDLEQVDREQVEKLLGEQSARDLEQLQELTRKLEEAGYLERKGDALRLTARAIRKIGDKALTDVFQHLKKDRFGRHAIERRGAGGDRTDEAKPYEFGDPFLLDLRETLMNAVERNGAGTPITLRPADFEVFRTELSTQASTVVMLDMSRSMLNNGYYLPAKKVALALTSLIRGQFPRDSLHIVGFSLYAREFTPESLPTLSWTEWNVGTNMHAGFQLARRLLARGRGGNKQILMVTDGEPTAHMEGLEAEFSYPPTRRTLEETLKEVQRCTREGITINTFMLERSQYLMAFVEQMTRINRGRAFFSGAERLGEYLLVDYVSSKRRRVS